MSALLQHVDALRITPVTLRRHILPKVEELTGARFSFVAVELDEDISLGHLRPIEDKTLQNGWRFQVRYSNKLNLCWQRFVQCKEVMHAFDPQEAKANSDARVAQLLEEISVPLDSGNQTPVYRSENPTLWMALAVFCPVRFRNKYRLLYEQGHLTPYEVALKARIPEQYVPAMMSERMESAEKALKLLR
ncbi:MAG: hypothetical protein SGJ23_13425 [Alphaproteobacteria bacterium]|nr:hypothetical protein [Alphaproteobacteria bacterium]